MLPADHPIAASPCVRVALVFVCAVIVMAGCSSDTTSSSPPKSTSSTQPPPVVPAQYQSLVSTLQAQVAALATKAGTGSTSGKTVMASGLIAANGNIGTGLLTPNALQNVSTMLRAMQQMGLKGTMLEVGFPLLLPSFPNSAGYVSFYTQVAQMVHADKMTLSVEVNPVFRNPEISSLNPDYSGLTVDSYAAQQRDEAQTVIDTMHPDYLTILDEPDTFGANLGLALSSPATGVQLVNAELSGLNRGSTKVGAGAGTWVSPDYNRALLTQTSIDYLSLHVYPLAANDVNNLDTNVTAAAAANKPVVMDETWLYKNIQQATGGPAGGPAGAPAEQKLSSFSFFEPVDQQYLTEITRYARNHHFAFLSPFQTPNFFAYVTWTPQLDAASSAQVRQLLNQQAQPNMTTGTLSSVGATYQQLSREKS